MSGSDNPFRCSSVCRCTRLGYPSAADDLSNNDRTFVLLGLGIFTAGRAVANVITLRGNMADGYV